MDSEEVGFACGSELGDSSNWDSKVGPRDLQTAARDSPMLSLGSKPSVQMNLGRLVHILRLFQRDWYI